MEFGLINFSFVQLTSSDVSNAMLSVFIALPDGIVANVGLLEADLRLSFLGCTCAHKFISFKSILPENMLQFFIFNSYTIVAIENRVIHLCKIHG